MAYYQDGDARKCIVFQVKFVRKQETHQDLFRWLANVMKLEAPKLRRLGSLGASQYVLITNLAGTAHLNSGTIDKVAQVLANQIDVPTMCWWRDDIARRLDNAWDLKWAYPALMTGSDFLRAISEAGLKTDHERRSTAIRAFVQAQHDLDEEVRFKQVELQNKLLDLFIDVPIAIRDHGLDRRTSRRHEAAFRQLTSKLSTELDDSTGLSQGDPFDTVPRWSTQQRQSFGAATLLLSPEIQAAMPRMVVEGAPGQGKSTITQYVCQVHRIRLLNLRASLRMIPKVHLRTAIRFPIKVDLRDFALWLTRRDPFNVDRPDLEPKHWHRSLEAFLAALVGHYSGGTVFTSDDLLAVLRISSTVIVLDGLDEVADLNRRKEVVEEIMRGIQRLEANTASLQTIVTSRPAAFANSPGMPEAKYPYLQLHSLTRTLIKEYSERWLAARRLDQRQGAEFRAVLTEKLDQPHLRDLATNPMQLAILLSLVQARGSSLPDQRTALYDYYIDLFFSREASKSDVVRDHRDLLVNIHRYLGWLLHSEAESGSSSGSVSQDTLQKLVAEYLEREGHDVRLANQLFTGMVERVVALVSRVEGTFEFEVQPLREYFAACHLYYTAPHSSPGKESAGAKPDRFDAIARNFYWQNVTRFYAGCYSKGELPSLAERLQELAEDVGFGMISYPRRLAVDLLSDLVFTQNPRSVTQVLDLILDPSSLRYLLATHHHRPHRDHPLVLPPKCGREQLVERCFARLATIPPSDIAEELIFLLIANSDNVSGISEKWLAIIKSLKCSRQREQAIDFGVRLGILSKLPLQDVSDLMPPELVITKPGVTSALMRACRFDYLHSTQAHFDGATSHILDKSVHFSQYRRIESPLELLAHSLDFRRYSRAFYDRQPISLDQYITESGPAAALVLKPEVLKNTEHFEGHHRCLELAATAHSQSQRTTIEWATLLDPWEIVVEQARQLWGDRWAIATLANVASSISSASTRCEDCDEFVDPSRSLAGRFRFARLQPGTSNWWSRHLDACTSGAEFEIRMTLLAFFSWKTAHSFVIHAAVLDVLLGSLGEDSWHTLFNTIQKSRSFGRTRSAGGPTLSAASLPGSMGLRLALLLADQVDPPLQSVIYDRFISGPAEGDPIALGLSMQIALDLPRWGTPDWKPRLDEIRRLFADSNFSDSNWARRDFNPFHFLDFPIEIAKEVLRSPDELPSFLVAHSEQRLREHIAANVIPVATIAKEQKWFGE